MESISNIIKKISIGLSGGSDKAPAQLDAEQLQQLVRQIVTTRPDEIGCNDCWHDLDGFVEMELAGKDAATAMPLVEDHLKRCRNCREEYQALLEALRAMA